MGNEQMSNALKLISYIWLMLIAENVQTIFNGFRVIALKIIVYFCYTNAAVCSFQNFGLLQRMLKWFGVIMALKIMLWYLNQLQLLLNFHKIWWSLEIDEVLYEVFIEMIIGIAYNKFIIAIWTSPRQYII